MNISIQSDTAGPALSKLFQFIEEHAPLLQAMGHRLVRDTSRHVLNWGLSHPNQLGGRRTNYWSSIAARINPSDCLQVNDNDATVTLGGSNMPGLMRAFGDITIVPGTKTAGVKYLALPARAESYGMRPREFGQALTPFWTGKGRIGGLAQAIPVTRKKNTRKGAAGTTYSRPGLVMYWFKDQVTQPQDRSLLPSEADWTASVNAGAAEYARQQMRSINGQ